MAYKYILVLNCECRIQLQFKTCNSQIRGREEDDSLTHRLLISERDQSFGFYFKV